MKNIINVLKEAGVKDKVKGMIEEAPVRQR